MEELKYAGRRDGVGILPVRIGNIEVGRDFLLAAGPCSVESEEEILSAARAVAAAGANYLRGGVFKPRTSPYSFRGPGREGLALMRRAADSVGLPFGTEVLDPRDIEIASEYADAIHIGARNMQNFPLLIEAGRQKKPVILKRGLCATLSEWLLAAEYIMNEGNMQVILCERGVRGVDEFTRNTLDLAAVPMLRELSCLPVIVDPSHGTGRASLVAPMSLAAVAAGCDGLMIEVHPDPPHALSDSAQQLTFGEFSDLAGKVRRAVEFGRSL